MEITFSSDKLKKLLSDEAAMARAFGQMAKALRRRLTVLRAATCLDDVPRFPPDRCHQLTLNRDEQFAVDVKQPKRLIFDVANDPIPRKADGGIDLRNVTAIRLVEIADYH